MMNKIVYATITTFVVFLVSCNVATDNTEPSGSDLIKRANDSTAKAVSDSATKAGENADSSLRSLDDSTKANIHGPANKIAAHSSK